VTRFRRILLETPTRAGQFADCDETHHPNRYTLFLLCLISLLNDLYYSCSAIKQVMSQSMSQYTWTDYKTNTQITKELKITPILDKLLEYKRNWIQHLNRMPCNRLPRVMKHYSPTGRRKFGRTLKRLLDTWNWNGSTSGTTPWQIYDDEDDDDDDSINLANENRNYWPSLYNLLQYKFCFNISPYNITIEMTMCWGEYLGLRGMRSQGNGENYIMRSLVICTPYPILCGW